MSSALFDKIFTNISAIIKFVLATVLYLSVSLSAQAISLPIETNSEQTSETKTADPYGRESPFGSTQGIQSAIQQQDMALLSAYLDPTFVERNLLSEESKENFLHNITQLINQNTSLVNSQDISREETGKLDDTLDEDLEKIGEINIEGTPDVILQRIDDTDGEKIWVLSNDFLKQVYSYNQSTTPNLLNQYLPESLKFRVFGYSAGHILASVFIMVIAYILGSLLSFATINVIKQFFRKTHRRIFSLKAVLIPVSVIYATYIYNHLLTLFEVELLTRELMLSLVNVLKIIAIAWLCYRVINLISNNINQKIEENQYAFSKSIVFLSSGVAKASVMFVSLLMLLRNFNVDVTSGIALLGLGGLAIALGAQKIIENLMASVVVVADRPIDIGDLCKFGTTHGTVESIGIRSTRIRTLERTLVTIPNGFFSSMEIENYSKRDRFLFKHLYAFKLNTKRADLEALMLAMQSHLDERSESVVADSRIRLRYIERDCLKVEVNAYIMVDEFDDFLIIQQQLLLEFMDMIEQSPIELFQPASVASVISSE